MTANKHQKVRAAYVGFKEIRILGQHNDANMSRHSQRYTLNSNKQ
jgi:ribose 5-phosphate isomerase RpiB